MQVELNYDELTYTIGTRFTTETTWYTVKKLTLYTAPIKDTTVENNIDIPLEAVITLSDRNNEEKQLYITYLDKDGPTAIMLDNMYFKLMPTINENNISNLENYIQEQSQEVNILTYYVNRNIWQELVKLNILAEIGALDTYLEEQKSLYRQLLNDTENLKINIIQVGKNDDATVILHVDIPESASYTVKQAAKSIERVFTNLAFIVAQDRNITVLQYLKSIPKENILRTIQEDAENVLLQKEVKSIELPPEPLTR